MPSESISQPQPKSLESLKTTFKQRLDNILNKQLTVENIEIFAEEALNETGVLRSDILKEYKGDKEEIGDEVFEEFDLPNIDEILESIIDVQEKIQSLKTYITANTENIDKVITPPQENHNTNIKAGDGSFEKKEIFPRLLTLMYILEHDFQIPPNDVKITEGKVTPDMMRKTPYVRIEIPELNRAVYICEEEDNASYIFDMEKIKEAGLNLEEIDLDDKGDKNSLIAYHSGIGIRIIQTKNWRTYISRALGEEIPETQKNIREIHDQEERQGVSEFREKKVWLPFDDFKIEVSNLYPGEGAVQSWYHKERKNHDDWPSMPSFVYKKDWVDWPELVGKENRLKKDYLPFSDFKIEVKELYPKKGDVQKWYHKERKNHNNWPSAPHAFYRDKGWVDWSEIVGKENHLKKDYLQFSDFQAEVKSLYQGQGDVEKWYKEEQKNHKNWPSHPHRAYENKGWEGFPELVGKENRSKKEYPPFDVFQREVINLYQIKGKPDNVGEWYHKERKNHFNWPVDPQKVYKVEGWEGFPELVGKENFLKKDYLPFSDFQTEVRSLYEGQGDVQEWYHRERKNHKKNWPSIPSQVYKDEGWVGFPELVGKNNRIRNKKNK